MDTATTETPISPAAFLGPFSHYSDPVRDLTKMDHVSIAKLIEELMNRADATMSETARAMGITRQFIQQLRNGKRQPTLIPLLHLLAVCGGRLEVELPEKRRT